MADIDQSLLPKELQTGNAQKDDISNLPKVGKAIAGTAMVKKPNLSKKILQIFMPEDVGSLKEFIWYDLIVPGIRDGFFNMVNGITSMICYGKPGVGRGNRNGGSQRSNATYRFDGEPYPYDRGQSSQKQRSASRVRSNVLDDVILSTPGDAYAVKETLIAYMEKYNRVPVSVYYDACGVSSDRPWTDERWGWTSLAELKVIPARGGGWIVYLPDPEPLN